MALSRTLRGNAKGVDSQITTGSFTPNNNSMLFAILFATGDDYTTVPQTPALTDSAGLTWTLRHSHYKDSEQSTGFSAQIWVYSAPVTTGVSMTCSFDTSEATQELQIHVIEYTGGDTSSPVGATATGAINWYAIGARSITLSAAPATTSEVLGVCLLNDYSSPGDSYVSPDTGWTEIIDSLSTDTYQHAQVQVRSGSTSTSVGWSQIYADQTGEHAAMLALEIKEASASDTGAGSASGTGTATGVGTSTTEFPTYVGKGTFASGTSTIAPGLPTGWAEGDLFLLQIESANQTIAEPSGWTQVTSSPQSTGTAAAAGGVRLGVFYRWATASEGAPTLADSGDHTTALISAYRNVNTTTPINVQNGGVDSSATTAISTPSVTTTVDYCLIVHMLGLDKDAADTDTITGTWTNANLLYITERHDQTVTSGAGGGVALVTGVKASAGSTGATTNTADSSTTHAYITLALAPDTGESPGVGAASGTGASSGVGASTAASAAASSGTGTATAVGASTAAAVGAASGTGDATAVGQGVTAAVGDASGAGDAAAVGASTAAGLGSADGTGTASAVGISTAASAGDASGTGTASGVGASTAAAVGDASGTGAASGVGQGVNAAAGTAAGAGDATGVGASTVVGVGASSGTGTAAGVGASTAASDGAATGTGGATGVGASTAAADGSAAGVGDAVAEGSALEDGAGVGSATGTGSASGVGASTAASAGTAQATGTASGVGAAIVAAVGEASGTGTAEAVSGDEEEEAPPVNPIQGEYSGGGGGRYWVRADREENPETIDLVGASVTIRFATTQATISQSEIVDPVALAAPYAKLKFTTTDATVGVDDTAEVIDIVQRIRALRAETPQQSMERRMAAIEQQVKLLIGAQG